MRLISDLWRGVVGLVRVRVISLAFDQPPGFHPFRSAFFGLRDFTFPMYLYSTQWCGAFAVHCCGLCWAQTDNGDVVLSSSVS